MPEIFDLLFFIVAGAGVGLAVGLTGVGGGSLMTPILIMVGIPPKTAIGTDLLYAAFTKSGALFSHHKQRNVSWPIVAWICAGSLPASVLTSLLLKKWMEASFDYEPILTSVLGGMLILTAAVILGREIFTRLSPKKTDASDLLAYKSFSTKQKLLTLITGLILGALVTLSSVGAGAIGAALLLTLFPALAASKIVGTDIAHAVPLTLIAGLGHLWNQHVDFVLLAGLLTGSLPAVHFASSWSKKVPSHWLRRILALILVGIGLGLFLK